MTTNSMVVMGGIDRMNRAKKQPRIFWTFRILPIALLACWLVPTVRAQNFITAQPGLTRIFKGQTSTTTQNYVVSLPSNTSSLSFTLENTSSLSITYTLSFGVAGTEPTTAQQTNIVCVQNPNANLASQTATTFSSQAVGGGLMFTYSCPYPTSQKIQITITATASNQTWAMYLFCATSQPYPTAATVTATTLTNGINVGTITEKGARWSINTTASVSAQATVARAAGGTGVRHVADCMEADAGATTAPAATTLAAVLRDGASGAGTILWQGNITAAASAAQHGQFIVCGLNLIGSANTAMTVEFTAALTNELEHVSLSGYDVQ